MKKLIFTLFLGSIISLIYSQEISTIKIKKRTMSTTEIANTYYKALYSQDFDKVREISSPNLIFEDPTSPPGLIPAKVSGLDSVITYFQTNLPKLNVDMTITKSYASNGCSILHQNSSGTTLASTFGIDGDKIRFQIQGVTVIQVKNGLVIRHIDYFDYSGLFSSFRPVE